MAKGNRISALPQSEFCGMSGTLGAQHGAGRAAAMSRAFHALCSGEDASTHLAKLTPAEREDISHWKKPADLDLGEGGILRWQDAQRELSVGLTHELRHTAYDDPEAVTCGTLDGGWVTTLEGTKVAVVGDIKKSRFTSELDTLQLAAYGFAYADLHGCEAMSLGLWIAEDGVWKWGDTIDLYSLEAAALGQRVLHAALNLGEFNTGAHCSGCYSRLYCPEYLLPPSLAETELGPLCEPWTDDKGPDVLLDALLKAQRAKQTAERVIDLCKEVANRHGGIPDGKGKVWRVTEVMGRESVSVDGLRKQLGEQAEQFIKRGSSYQQARWVRS